MEASSDQDARQVQPPPLLTQLARVLARRAPGYAEVRVNPRRRASSVLVPFFIREGELRALLILRTSSVATHKGQVAFPGGATDPEDGTMLDTALRESREEVGIDPGRVAVLGALQPFDTIVSNFVIHPFVGFLVEPDPVFVPQPSEVETALEIPLEALRDRRNRHRGLVPGFSVPIPLPYYKVNDTVIWGASGAILGELLTALDEADAAE